MTFAQFCKSGGAPSRFKSNIICYSDILPKCDNTDEKKGLRAHHLSRIRKAITEFEVCEDTYFETLEILSDPSLITPAHQSYIFGYIQRGAWLIVIGDFVYIVGRGKASVSAVQSTASTIKNRLKIVDFDYSWWPCYAM